MAANNPTVVITKLDGEQLKNSVNELVSVVKKGFESIESIVDSSIGKINEKLATFNTGAKNLTKTIEGINLAKTTETAIASYDRLLGSLQLVQRQMTVISNRGLAPSSLNEYTELLMKANELTAQLAKKTGEIAMLRAQSNEQKWSFDAKANIRDLEAVDERLKQLNKYYKELENQSRKAAISELGDAFKMPTNNINEIWNKILKIREVINSHLGDGLIPQKQVDNANQLITKLHEVRREMERQRDIATQSQINEDYKLHYARAMRIPTTELDLVQTKLEHLQMLLQAMRERGLLTPTQIAATEHEIQKLESMLSKAADAQARLTQQSEKYQSQDFGARERQMANLTNLANEFNRIMSMPIAQGTSTEFLQLQEKSMALIRILQQLKDTDVIPPERIQAARQELIKIHEEIERLAERYKNVPTMFGQAATGGRAKNTVERTFAYYDNLQDAIAHVLKIQSQSVILANTATDSYNRLQKSLNQLQQAYNNLTVSEKNSEQGKALAASIRELNREIDKANKQRNRPNSLKEALGYDEHTIDDLRYKISQLENYKSGIKLGDEKSKNEIKKVDEEVNRLNGELNKYMSTARNASAANNTLTRSWNYMKNRLAFYFTVGASTQFIKNLIEVRGQYEMNERALGILIDSAERGTKIFHQLSQMALISPYTLIELSNAAKQLSAYGVEAGDLYDTTRRLADVAAAVGAPIERISYALGHIQSYGYLTSLQARQFANMGIPLVKALAERYTELEGRIVSVADVYDRMKKKQVSYNDVMAVVNKMTDKGGRFFDFQAKVADTLKVQVANLTLAWNNMLNAIGSDTQGAISALIKGLKETLLHWVQIKDAIASAAWAFGLLKAAQFLYFAWFGKAADRVGAKFAAQYVMGQKMTDMFNGLGKALKSLFLNPWTWVFVGIAAIVDMTISLKSANEAIVKFNQELAKVGKERFDKIGEFLNTFTKTSSVDASKSWEAIKEEIEQSSSASASFIAQLEKIEDISQRIDVAEKMLKDIQQVQGVVSKFGDNSVKINQTLWHGLFGEGLMDDFDDFIKSGSDVIKTFGDLAEAEKYYNESVARGSQDDALRDMFSDYIRDAQEFREELDATYESLKRIATDKNFNALQQRELMETIAGQETQDKSQEQQLKFRIELEKKFTENYKKEIDAQIAYSESVGNTARANELKARRANWLAQFGEGRALTEGFFSYLQATAKTETEDMFKGMSAEEIKHIDTSKPEWKAWAKEIAQQFSKEYGLSFKDLWAYIQEANTWSILIPVYFKTIGLPLNDVLKDYQKRTGKAAQGDIANAKSQVEIIELLQKKQADLAKTIETAKKAGGEYYDKNKQQWNEENKDLTDQIHAYGALTKAEEQAAKSANKRHTGRTGKKDKPEDKVAKALKDELSVIKEMQSNYEKLRKAGFSANKALTIASYGYEQTLGRINAILTKYGVSEFKASDFVGKDATDPNTLLKALKEQRATLLKSGKVKMESIKDLDIEIQRLSVSAKEYNMQKITEGLNNQLNKIKDEYELAVELDANPELGQIFTDALGIDTSKFPKTVQDAIYEMQSAADAALDKAVAEDTSILDEGKVMEYFDILEGDIQKWADEMGLETTSTLVQSLQDYQTQARDLWKKDAAETIAQWEKLLEKYGEYVAKRKQILLDYENDLKTARRNNAPQSVYDAIETRNAQQLAGLDFEMLQQSQTWITATGDLSKLADSAIQVLINDLVKFKKANKNLDPKNMQKINKTLRQLYKQQKSENPFLALARVFDAAKERFDEYQAEIDQTRAAIKKYEDMVKDGEILNANQIADLTRLKDTFRRLKREQQEVSKVSITEVVGAINSIGQAANAVNNDLAAMFDALSGTGATETKKTISDITGILEKGGQGAALGAQIGGGWGALIGGVAAGLAATVTTFFDKWSGNADITKQIEDSQWEVKKLEQAYQKLEYAIEDAYGAAKYGAMQAAIANKKLQLVELQHQLDLEKSRKKKNQDKEAILELENSIISLEREIQTGLRDITNDMLGISSIGDAAESMVSAMIDAFKAGEDYMGKYSESFDEMIDNMIVKAIVGKVIGDKMQQVFDFVDSLAQGRGGIYNDQITDLQAQLNENRRQQSIYEQEKLNSLTSAEKEWYDKQISLLKQQEQMLLNHISMAGEEYAKAVVPTPEDVDQIRNMTAGWSDEVKALFDAYMAAFGITFGQGADKNLSALQQGIQGITEDTAGALEAITNGISQQSYLQSDLLTQIRDSVVAMDFDVNLGVMSQILLQLQTSYQAQQAIQSILEGWSSPNGMSVRVEMI